MKRILFLLAAGFVFFVACNDDEPIPCSTSNSGIYGTWDWLQSTHYFTANEPIVEDPSTEGYTKSIEITTNNTAYLYKNGILDDSTTFTIINDQISFNTGSTYYYSVDSCILILDLSYVDGSKEEYQCACDVD